MANTFIAQPCKFMGTIDIPIYAAPYSVPANGGTAPHRVFNMNTNGNTPFSDSLAYNTFPSSAMRSTIQNGTITYLDYFEFVTTTINGGYNVTGLVDGSFEGSLYNNGYAATWTFMPGAPTASTLSPLYVGQYSLGLTGANIGAPSLNLQGSILQYQAQFTPTNTFQPLTSSNNRSNGATNILLQAAVVISDSQDPLEITDTGERIQGTGSSWVVGSSVTFFGLNYPIVSNSFVPSTSPPPLILLYNQTNYQSISSIAGTYALHGSNGFDNFIWYQQEGSSPGLFARQMSVFYDLRTSTITPITDMFNASGLGIFIVFDDPALQTKMRAGQYQAHACKGGTATFFQTVTDDYIISYDGTQYWKLNYISQIPNMGMTGGYTEGTGILIAAQVKTIDANNIFWYTGGQYNGGGTSGNITPLYSFALNINLPTISIPAFPPLQLPCFADCLAQGSVLAKQTKWG